MIYIITGLSILSVALFILGLFIGEKLGYQSYEKHIEPTKFANFFFYLIDKVDEKTQKSIIEQLGNIGHDKNK